MGVCWVGGCDMPGSECRGGRAFWVPLTAASGEALAPPQDTGEAFGLTPAHLTVTFGLGPSLFDGRFGLSDHRPEPLRTLPALPGDELEPARSNGDLARAMGLIEPLLRSTAPDVAPWQPFARFVQVRYAEQRRLEEALDRQIKEQRDTRNRLDQANEKLEALKAIERSLGPRPAPLVPNTAPKGP